MSYNEADTRAKLIDPMLYLRGWTEELISREETIGAIEIVKGKARRRNKRVDYALRVKINPTAQPVAVALIEAKAENLPPDHGLEQVAAYAEKSKRLNVPFVFSSNGHLFVELDRSTGVVTEPRPLTEFPPPDELQRRYEQVKGIKLDSDAARPLITPYQRGEGGVRYYQDAAIRAVLEQLARQENNDEPRRALLSLATGSGKTVIAVDLMQRIADAGTKRKFKVLFVCDRNELRKQATLRFQDIFGSDSQPVGKGKAQKTARVLVATYQSLDNDSDDEEANILLDEYEEDYFSHIIIDECHRSAWGKWKAVLLRNPNAAHIGLTATPRQLDLPQNSDEIKEDIDIARDNFRYFGDPVYEYSITQGIEDGYLAACEVVRNDVLLDSADETKGLSREQLESKLLSDDTSGEALSKEDIDELYEAGSLDRKIMLPERLDKMCRSLFDYLVATGTPHQKTIIFCTSDRHAGRVATKMRNIYIEWCRRSGQQPVPHYSVKATGMGENDSVANFKGYGMDYFIATTVDLLSTGVDIPSVRNIVFFRYVKSPILFYQMIGRGTRPDPATNKMMFRVYDYTNATERFGEKFVSHVSSRSISADRLVDELAEEDDEEQEEQPHQRVIHAEGFDVVINDAGRYILTTREGRDVPVQVEEYERELAAKLVAAVPTIEELRSRWIDPQRRQQLEDDLNATGYSPKLLRAAREWGAYDLYDLLAQVGFGMAPLTRQDRAYAFRYKNDEWLKAMNEQARAAIVALTDIFASEGVEELEKRRIFTAATLQRAGGIAALRQAGEPQAVIQETKERIFAA